MALSTNAWNRLRYSLWSFGYDAFTRPFIPMRRRSISQLALRPGERVLIVGAGTGADLPLLPAEVEVLATDLTPAMLARAERWVRAAPDRARRVRLAVMDVATRRVQLVPRLGDGKSINPQFGPDGQTLYFVSNVDCVSVHLPNGAGVASPPLLLPGEPFPTVR